MSENKEICNSQEFYNSTNDNGDTIIQCRVCGEEAVFEPVGQYINGAFATFYGRHQKQIDNLMQLMDRARMGKHLA